MNNTDFNPANTTGRQTSRVGTQLWIGLVVVLVGLGMLLRRMDFPLPDWLFGWEMILIIVGIISGIKSKFRDVSWIIPIVIGLVFMLDDVFALREFRQYIWPLGIIFVGLVIAFRPRFGARRVRETEAGGWSAAPANSGTAASVAPAQDSSYTISDDDQIDATAIFGGVKRSVVSKHFQGGEVVAIFGGAEINLSNADINGIVKLEVVNVLGGTKLIVPATWDVQSTMVAIFGGVDDKRIIRPELIDPNKKLIIEGTSFLGGLEIKSF